MSMTISNVRQPARNGSDEPLPEHGQKQVEAGLAMYQRIVAERDELENKLHEAHLELEGMRVQLSSLKSIVNMMESSYASIKIEADSRVHEHQRQRDAAVGRTASLEAVLVSAYTMMSNAIDTFNRESGDHPAA
jgi:hypothetical protein